MDIKLELPNGGFSRPDERQEMLHKIERFQEAMAIGTKKFRPSNEDPLGQIVSFFQFELQEEIESLKKVDINHENKLWDIFHNLEVCRNDLEAIIENTKDIPNLTKHAPKGFTRRGRFQAMIDVSKESSGLAILKEVC